MARAFTAAAASLLLLASGAARGDAETPPATDAQLRGRAEALRLVEAWLDGEAVFNRVPSLSAAVAQGDDLVWSKGYGTLDAAHTVATTASTIYSICSISKLFTSIALMQQWELGKVRLDEPLSTYLPWAQLKPSGLDSVPITLRAVLSHSAGLPRESDFPYWTAPGNPFPTRAQLRAKLAEQSPLYPASRWFQYSNLGLTLVGETVEAVAHEPYAAYAQDHVLGPLALTDTRPFMPMELYGTRLAVGWGAIKRDQTRDLLPPFDARGLAPAAGYTSTALDLAKFASWQFRLLRTEKAEVLKASTLREMQRVQFTDPSWTTTWGLGFTVSRRGDHTYVGHGGSCPGYHTILELRPETETAVVVMTTGAGAPDGDAAGVFALLDKRRDFAFKGAPAAAGVDLEAYAGRYSDQPWGPESVIAPWAGGLAVLSLPSAAPAEDLVILKPKGGDRFRVIRPDGSEADEVVFQRNAKGAVESYVRFSNPFRRLSS